MHMSQETKTRRRAAEGRRQRPAKGLVLLVVVCSAMDTGTVTASLSKCEPFPDCATSWVETAIKEKAAASAPLDDMMVAITKGSAQNCTRSTQCASEKRIEEIDEILAGLQKKWEEQAVAALAARSKVEDSLWQRWIKEAQDLVQDLKRLEGLRDEKDAVMSDVWLQRMSSVALDSSLLPRAQVSGSGGSFGSASDENASASAAALDVASSWSRGGAMRTAALSDSWSMRQGSPPNITRDGVISTVKGVAKCLLRELLDMAVEEGDVLWATCPPNAKADCYEVRADAVRAARLVRAAALCRATRLAAPAAPCLLRGWPLAAPASLSGWLAMHACAKGHLPPSSAPVAALAACCAVCF